jgi:hypothetical protein
MSKPRVCIRAKLVLVLLALVAPAISTSSQTDNCCFIDRQCVTNDEWVNGYYAFRNSECAAPSQQQPEQQRARQQRSTPAINNCCFIGWQCNWNGDWVSGYYAFQNDQCASQSQWQSQWQQPSSGAAAAGDQRSQGASGDQGPSGASDQAPQSSNQGTGGNDMSHNNKRCTTREDGTSICVVVVNSWSDFWRAVCRTYPDMQDQPECQ